MLCLYIRKSFIRFSKLKIIILFMPAFFVIINIYVKNESNLNFSAFLENYLNRVYHKIGWHVGNLFFQ